MIRSSTWSASVLAVRRATETTDFYELIVERRHKAPGHTDYRRPYSTYRDAYDATRGLFFFSITWGFE